MARSTGSGSSYVDEASVLESIKWSLARSSYEQMMTQMAGFTVEFWDEETREDEMFNEVRHHLQAVENAKTKGAQRDALDDAAKALSDLQREVRGSGPRLNLEPPKGTAKA